MNGKILAMPDYWVVANIEDHINFIDYRGKTPKKLDSGIRLITAKNVKRGFLQIEPREYVDPAIYDDWMTRGIPRKGDVLFTTEAPLGNVAQLDTDEKVVFAQRIIIMQPDPDVLDSTFLRYLLLSGFMQSRIQDKGTGATAKGIKSKLLKTIPISFPDSLAEQQRIVSILDEAFAAIDRAKEIAQQNLANARELFESYLNRVFTEKGEGWEEKTLGEMLELGWITSHLDGNHGGDYPRKSEFVDAGIPYISANCLKGGKIDMSLAKFLSPERAAKLRKGIASDGDVLFAHNATVGPVTILRTDEAKVILGTSLTYYRCNPKHLIPEYLCAYMKSHPFTQQYKSVMRQSTRNQVPITKQRTFTHIVPPLSAQQEIAPVLESLYELADQFEQLAISKILVLDELKQSILQKAFTGQLTKDMPELENVS